ncbi:TetR/AcrR family transcriptional regulator [Salinicola rhizosphaerae]|uniref:TetR family transcriptional regulator n=1 Tax=Salinicola rhizosphaerae TaxID=1443141 RepID=A0ABQ3DYI6_9GAMM|nr:TetR/AcrR family transcriptional regulator [Salinicola rhizosphaerae]GHB17839.1 TetR family transcriptional regulator [Salinicola rhizosphaerae]
MHDSHETRARLLDSAEKLFDRYGFTATGMDRLTTAAGLSSRTLYKHVGSKNRLMAAVLDARDRRFMRSLRVASVDGLFDALARWFESEEARGCLFLRSWGETGGEVPEVAEAMTRHKQRLAERIDEIVEAEIGRRDEALAEEVLILFEGATHAAAYRGETAIPAARRAARRLIEGRRASG